MTDLRDVYGTCAKVPCLCLRGQWLGRLCVYWTPMGPANPDELARHWATSTHTTHPATTEQLQEEKDHENC